MVLDVAPLQQMKAAVLSASAHLFEPTVAFEYGQMLAGVGDARAAACGSRDGGPSRRGDFVPPRGAPVPDRCA